MNTFLPYPEFDKCARVLDRQRLGKQRVECFQLVRAITTPGAKGWVNHPCTRMWRPWLQSLLDYAMIMCEEWVKRGYNDALWTEFNILKTADTVRPPWLGSPKLHASHRANLTRKDPLHYGKYWTDEPAVFADYFWPGAFYYWPLYEKAS